MTVPLCTMKVPHFDELLRVDFLWLRRTALLNHPKRKT